MSDPQSSPSGDAAAGPGEPTPQGGSDSGPPADRELFAPPPGTSPRGRRVLTAAAWICAAAAPFVPLAGVAGMVAGTLAHVKGDRAGLVGAVVAGLTTIVGMTLVLGLR